MFILKARGIGHTSELRRFLIDDHGAHVGERFRQLHGVLTGIPQPERAAVRAAARRSSGKEAPLMSPLFIRRFFPKRSRLIGSIARTLYDIAQGFDSHFDPEPRIRRALKLLRRIVPYHQCALLEESTGESHLVVEPDTREDRETLSPLLTRLLTVLSDEAKRGADMASLHVGHLAPLVAAAHLAVPIVGLDRVLGVLFVRDGKPDAFTDEHLQTLSVVASQIAAYLNACRLHKQDAQIVSEHKAARVVAVAESRAKDEFLAMLTHELRNPVMAIDSAMQTIRNKAEPNVDIQQAMDAAAQQVKHLSWLLDDLSGCFPHDAWQDHSTQGAGHAAEDHRRVAPDGARLHRRSGTNRIRVAAGGAALP